MLSEEAKIARREYMREWRKNNLERSREYSKKWNAKNKDKIKEYQKRYWERISEEKKAD